MAAPVHTALVVEDGPAAAALWAGYVEDVIGEGRRLTKVEVQGTV